MNKPIIVLTGPTASGKTAISFELANKVNGEIVCVDSMTVYRGMDIGTDKPTLEIKESGSFAQEKDGSYLIRGIRHHMLDIFNPDEECNVSIFQKRAEEVIRLILARGKTPILVGGSTLYIDAIVYGYQLPRVEPDKKLREGLSARDVTDLFTELCSLDPDSEWTIDRHNKRRVIRALEVLLKTGQPLSGQKHLHIKPKNVLYLAVSRERQDLYQRINSRVDLMVKEGFIGEVRSLYEKYDHNTAMQAAGYKQLSYYLDGILDEETAIEKTKQAHRNYAKRQMTWLNRNKDIVWISDSTSAIATALDFLKS